MFTNNYINFRNSLFFGNNLSGKNYLGTSRSFCGLNEINQSVGYCDIGKNLHTARCGTPVAGTSQGQSPDSTRPGVYFGTGNTPATKNDYCLESLITTGLSITNPSSIKETNDGAGRYSFTAEYIVNNTTDAEINIYEIGVVTSCKCSNDYCYHPYMMERTVLTTPITVPVGLPAKIVYTITFNQTLNVE